MKFLACLITILSFQTAVFAVSPSTGPLFTYEGLLTDSGGTPITTAQTVTFQIIYPSSCLLYSENHSITPGSSGEFSVIIGSGTRTDSTNNTAARIFASSGTVGCEGSAATSVSGFTTRSLHIKVGASDLSPDVAINNVPFAINAQKLADKGADDFVQISPTITQTNLESTYSRYSILNDVLNIFSVPPAAGQVLLGNGSTYAPGSLVAGSNIAITAGAGSMTISASNSGGTVTGVTTNAPLSVVSGSTTPIISIAPASSSVNGYLTSGDWTAFNNKMNSTLNTGLIWVGNGSNQATATSVSGDAALSAGGALTLSSVGSAGTYYKVTTDGKGRVTSGVASLTSTDIPNLDWSKITSGKPTTLAGYGISDVPSLIDATSSTKGVVQIGSGLTVSSGVVAADPANFPGTVPVAKGGTGVSSITANSLLASNGTGNSLIPFYCPTGQMMVFDASHVPGCVSHTSQGLFTQSGNAFGAAAVLGTTDSNSLSLMANSLVGLTMDTAARIGIGIAPTGANKVLISDANAVPLEARSSALYTAIAIRNTNVSSNPWYMAVNSSSSTFGPSGSFSLIDFNAAVTRISVLSDGKVGFGTTSPLYAQHTVVTGTGAVAAFQNTTGTCTITPNTSSLSCTSDIRLKKNFEKIIGLEALNKIITLQAMTYQWKHGDDEGRHIGYIAQEAEKIVPELVITGGDGYKQVSYSGFVPLLSEAIKEVHENQKRDVASIQQENTAMKKQLEDLRAENETLKKDLNMIKDKLGLK